VFRPDVDILERGDAYLIYADLPGVDDKHVRVDLDKGVLSLEADLATAPEEAWEPIHTEYRFGSFHREFRLSEEIDTAGVSASMRDGVLELRLPKTEKHQPRRIAVQAG
jgi:HSP20 family protein